MKRLLRAVVPLVILALVVGIAGCTNSGENNLIPANLLTTETPVSLSLNLSRHEYDPGEQVITVAELKNVGTPLSGASVVAEIKRPDNKVDKLALYDDGLHGDGNANDGIYANAYANTATWGMYYITLSASGTADGKEFAGQTLPTVVWIQLYPDLTLTSADISFSDNAPVAGKNITISATISNIGGASSGNAAVLFYDGGHGNGVEIGETPINLAAGKTGKVSISWKPTAGRHEIHVLISACDGELQGNYSNDEGYKIIDVK
jgi:hypothetical protein